MKLLWWKKNFPSSSSTISLGKEFQQAREEKSLSVREVSAALRFSEEIVIALEKGESYEVGKPSLFDPGYFRLAAVTYARFLGLDLSKIDPLLPPLAPLKASYTTFVKKLSPLQQKPRKPHFIRQEQQLTYSLKDVKFFLCKVAKIIIALIGLFYLLNWGRHLTRVIF